MSLLKTVLEQHPSTLLFIGDDPEQAGCCSTRALCPDDCKPEVSNWCAAVGVFAVKLDICINLLWNAFE